MVSKKTVDETIARLDRAIASGDMPPAANSLAERISKRLKSPVRLAIMGLKGAGKSRLLNFLVGDEVIPENIRLPSILVAWGKTPKIDYTLANGKTKSLETFDINEISRLKPVFIRLRMPLPALKKISILEVVTSTNMADQQRALAWAAPSTDIALWCTQEFSETESDLWNTLPGALQDHSFMIMTKADQHPDRAARERKLNLLKEAAEKRFHSFYHIDTLQALAARGENGKINGAKLSKSGGQELIGAVLQAVDQGVQASLDGAVILFARYEIPMSGMPAATPPPPEESIQEAPPEVPTELLVPKDTPAPQTGQDDFSSEIVTYLTDRVKELQIQLSKSDAPDSETVMAQCYEDVEWLVEQLTERSSDNPDILHTLDACQDAADMMLLLQLENHDSAVEDAVVLLLQIKRDFEQKIAA
jgi:GTPase SAR1 family protein